MSDTDPRDDAPERRRPRVVDRRVSARRDDEAPAPAPETPPPAAPPQPEATATPQPQPEPAPPPGGEQPMWTPEQEAEARRMAEEIARVPARDWVVSAAMNLVNVATVKLDAGTPAEAQLAIDALAGLLDRVGDGLGDVARTFRQLLAQLQMAYAEIVSQQPPRP
ncbi:MAG TPA: hypothetical protein VHJ34_05410 [Actinomycetota bacterium]|nr:hypothetical protein [Actinomycetota bacterium]